MLLQTILQLNILILATPALAGWSLLPPVHGLTSGAVGIVWQYRAAETPVPKISASRETQQVAYTAALMRLSVPVPVPMTVACAPAPRTLFASLSILSQAARAP